MKSFIKIFFILIYAFISIGVNSVAAIPSDLEMVATSEIITEITIPSPELGISTKNEEANFILANTRNTEINSLRDRKDSFSNGTSDKTNAQKRLLYQLLLAYSNNTRYITFYKKSLILQNELCSRAP